MSANVVCMPENPVFHQIHDLLRNLSVQTVVCGQLNIQQSLIHEKTVDSTIIAMPVRGRYEMTFDQKTWFIRPGQTVIVPSGMPVRIVHHLDRDGAMQAKWVHLHLTLYDSIDLLNLFDLPARLSLKQSQPISQAIDQLLGMKLEDSANHPFLKMLQSHQIATRLAEHLIHQGKISSHRIKNLQESSQLVPVFQAIAQHLNKPISIDDLCRWAHLSPSRLHTVFLETTGMAPIRYVLQARLKRARQQLIYTDMPISQIAQSLAFASPFHFSRVFRDAVGMSPSTYRTQNNLAQGM